MFIFIESIITILKYFAWNNFTRYNHFIGFSPTYRKTNYHAVNYTTIQLINKTRVQMKVKIKTELITNYIIHNDLSIKEFCRQCGISQNTYYRIMNGQTNIRIITMYKILVQTKILCKDILICE